MPYLEKDLESSRIVKFFKLLPPFDAPPTQCLISWVRVGVRVGDATRSRNFSLLPQDLEGWPVPSLPTCPVPPGHA